MRRAAFLPFPLIFALCGSAGAMPDGAPKGTGWTPDQNLLGHLEQVDDLNQFAALLKLTDLAAVLRTPGPFTVFAPTRRAFSYMPPRMLAELRLPKNKPQLTKILGCHIFPGKINLLHHRFTPATGGEPLVLKSITGCIVTVRSTGGAMFVDDVNGIKAAVGRYDIGETNGFINEIDGVLTPGASASR